MTTAPIAGPVRQGKTFLLRLLALAACHDGGTAGRWPTHQILPLPSTSERSA